MGTVTVISFRCRVPSTRLALQHTAEWLRKLANYRITFQMLSQYKAKETLLPTLLVTNKMLQVKRICPLVLDGYLLMCYSADFPVTQVENNFTYSLVFV